MREQEWTARRVEIRFEEAADTMRKLPPVIPKAYLCSWPTIIRDYWEQLLGDIGTPPLGSASPKAIKDMDEALEWLGYLSETERKIVWLRANHMGWPRLGELLQRDRTTVRRYWVQALEKIARRLNQQALPSLSFLSPSLN